MQFFVAAIESSEPGPGHISQVFLCVWTALTVKSKNLRSVFVLMLSALSEAPNKVPTKCTFHNKSAAQFSVGSFVAVNICQSDRTAVLMFVL